MAMAADLRIPQHIAIIMDGNGRWAKERGLHRLEGHREGVLVADRMVTHACKLGVRYLTLYAFSAENWARPPEEVSGLMTLLREFLISRTRKLCDHDVRLRVIGDTAKLPAAVRETIAETMKVTQACKSMTLTLALSYGARDELVRAVRHLFREHGPEQRDREIDAADISRSLDTAFLPDPDLMIRTSGEYRLSNFLLWQSAYTELIFMDTLWPDFSEGDLEGAIVEFNRRERRFGKTSEQLNRDG